MVEISIEVPADTPTVYLSGNTENAGNWNPKGLAMDGKGSSRSVLIPVAAGEVLNYKFTLGTWSREAVGDNQVVLPNFALSADTSKASHRLAGFKRDAIEYLRDPKGSGILGQLIVWEDVGNLFLQEKRHVTIWLPPEYLANPNHRFGVVYAQDGQNLFDPRIANTGTDWGLDESIVRLRAANKIEPTIVVGLWSTAQRAMEYRPNGVLFKLDNNYRAMSRAGLQGAIQGDAYLRLLHETVKPKVDAEFRTKPEARHTTLLGASLGGVFSLYGMTAKPEVFGRAACLSLHWPINTAREVIVDSATIWRPEILKAWAGYLETIKPADSARQRLWIDRGDQELDSLYADYATAMEEPLAKAGFGPKNMVHKAFAGTTHNEAAWRARLDEVLAYTLAA